MDESHSSLVPGLSDGDLLAVLRRGGVIAYPTEGVWGLGCLPDLQPAVERLLLMKSRDVAKGLILAGGSRQQFAGLADEIPDVVEPTTFLVRHNGRVPPWIHGDSDRVAIRISAHPIVVALCDLVGGPLVSTSANPAGKAPALNAEAVSEYFLTSGCCAVDHIVPGALGIRTGPSRIIDLQTGDTIRAST